MAGRSDRQHHDIHRHGDDDMGDYRKRNTVQIKNRSQWEGCERSAGIVISRQLFLPPL